jgi:hypothetical protein
MDENSWYITRRWQEYTAEGRVNLLRIVAIGVLYSVHLWSYASSQDWLPEMGFLQLAATGEIDRTFHVAVTLLAVGWAMLALGIQLALTQRMFPRWLPYISTGIDIVLLTSVVTLGAGPRSPLVAGYFLVLIASALRLRLSLVRCATATCIVGYLFVLGATKWSPAMSTLADARVGRYHQLIVVVSLIFAGVILGQLVRLVPLAAAEYATRIQARSQ